MQRFRGELWNIHRLHGSMKDRTGGDWLPLAMIKSVTLKILVWPVMMATSTVQMASVAPLQSTLQHGQHNAPRPVMADVASQAEESQSSHVVQGRKPCIIGRPTPSENYVNRASSTVRVWYLCHRQLIFAISLRVCYVILTFASTALRHFLQFIVCQIHSTRM